MRVSNFWLKCLFCVISATNYNIFLKAVLCSVEQSSCFLFSVFFSNGRRAAAVCAKFGKYCVRWCIDPIKLFNCLIVFGAESFSIASVFLRRGVVLSLVMLNPNHSICLQANLHYSSGIARFSLSGLPKMAF